jgi:hypothetical protein
MRLTGMPLPFTADEFFDVFARYNLALWPAALVMWLAAAASLVALVWFPQPRTDRAGSLVLAALWAWAGAVYHAAHFSTINPAAPVFAIVFLVEAAILAWTGLVQRDLRFESASAAARTVGILLALYALAYPGLNLLLGHTYPRVPTFGVPCPTTIFTVGLLMMSRRPPLAVMWIPLVWSLVGGSAAVVLDVAADYVLLACAPVLTLKIVVTRKAGR